MGVSLDSDNRVIGLITDGDIRRAMEKWQARFFDHTVSEIMTRTPKIVSPSTKVTEIQRVMHQYKIHSVLVCDKEKHLLGIVDSPGSTRVGDHNNSFSINYLYHFERIFL